MHRVADALGGNLSAQPPVGTEPSQFPGQERGRVLFHSHRTGGKRRADPRVSPEHQCDLPGRGTFHTAAGTYGAPEADKMNERFHEKPFKDRSL